jgi:GDP-L-fucose synthase
MDKINDGDALNLSTGISTSFIDFAKIATAIVGYYPKILGDTNKPVGVMSRIGDTDKQIEFGFKPKISFSDGVSEGINYWVGK